MVRLRSMEGAAHPRSGAGFTIIELVISLALLMLLASSVAATMISGLGIARSNRFRVIASHLASREMDTVRAADFATLPSGEIVTSPTVDGIGYTVTRNSEWISSGAHTSACQGGTSSPPAYLRVSVRVNWANMAGVAPVATQTVVAPPIGQYDAYTGHVSVQVLDRSALPLEGIPVHLTKTGVSLLQSTTSGGCAFFAYLSPATYTVDLEGSGYVDGQGAASPSQSAAVTVGTVKNISFTYDRAAQLQLTLAGATGAVVPTAVPVQVGNAHLLPIGTKVLTGSGATRTIANLFPYLDGYTTWTGDCDDADPQGQNNSTLAYYWAGALRDTALPMTPGGTTAGSVRMGTAHIQVLKAGVPQPGLTVVAHHDPDQVCTAGDDLTVGATDATGTITAALPFGTWKAIKVSGKSPQPAWPQVVIDPRNSTTQNVTVTIQ